MNTVVDIPGIHSDGEGNTRPFAKGLASRFGFKHTHPDLPKRSVIGVWFMLWRDVRLVANSLRHGDTVVCHSYGCLRGTLGVLRFQKKNPGDYVRLLFLIAPAMDIDFDFSGIDKRTKIVCLYSAGDTAIKLGTVIPLHRFGRAGICGFRHGRVHNISAHPNDHNDYFNQGQLGKWQDLFYSFASP